MDDKEILSLINIKELEIKRLQNEVDSLRKQLNVSKENNIQQTLTREEKVKIFMNYFKGRDDVYPYLSIDKNNPNVKYYIPACANEWKNGACNKTMGKKCRYCQYRENKPLSKDIIYKHMYENNPIGIYPLLENDTCYFLSLDFDNKNTNNDIKSDVLAFANICDKYKIPIAIERSRSGKGIHIWIFFDKNIKAITARKLGSLLLSKTMEISNLSISSFDRMFPNQDTLPKGGYGNLIALPFQNEPSKYGNTLFVDRSFIQIKNQIQYLNSIHKLTEEEVFEKIEKLSNETIDIGHEIIDMKKEVITKSRNNIEYPKSIKVTLDDMAYIDKANLDLIVKNSFRRLATFANPEFYQKQKLRMSVYNIPMVIDCSKEDDKYLKLPRGTYEYLESLCKTNNIKIVKVDKRFKGKKINVVFNGKLRDEQQKALDNLLKYENGILCAPTGFGKTVIGCKMIEERNVNTLILVNKIQLLNQWKDRIKKFLNIETIGEISSKKKNITNIIDVASIKSLWNNGDVLDITKNYGMIIIDECHHIAAYTFEQAINTGNAKYVYGISATPERENGHTPIIKMQCGDIRYKVDSLKFNKELNIPMKVIVKKSHLNFTDQNIDNYELNEINDLIAKDVLRSENIIKDIKEEYKKGKNILVLTERLKLMDYIYDKLSKDTNNIFKYYGGIGKKVLKNYEEHANQINEEGENKIIVATGSYIGEGFDDSKLDVLFLTMPISGQTRVTQYAGRLHRKDDNKKEILIYDYVDDNFSKTRNMFLKRKKTYEKLGYEIVDENELQVLIM
ncbi:MAG: DEAD/DEAH box helicase [Bacilli bacterium]|nr:DEAD/DEAH box helicase [Bacilli bacterium]